jgi:polyisoprenyl-teichoic acid--peptidoglycan teichoic acid transferase
MKKKILISIGSIIGILVIAAAGYAYHLYSSVKDTANQMHESVKLDTPHPKPDISQNAKPISILLMGVDERSGDVGRSDTLMVMTLNPQKKTMQLVSIPRDTRTEIIGRGTTDKINAAYAYGGPKMAIETVENFTGVKLDYYIRVNMEALSALVDAVGGITVQNDLDWYDEGYYKKGYHYAKGTLNLNGPEALGYVRMRHLDPNGDFGRNNRQRQILTAVVNKAASISSVANFNQILAALGDNVKTDLTFDDMMNIQKNYRDCRTNITQYEVKGTGETIGGIYYLNVSDAEKANVSNMLKANLQNN